MIGSGLKELAYKTIETLKNIEENIKTLPKIQTLLEEILTELKTPKQPTKRITAFDRYVKSKEEESPEFKEEYDKAKKEIAITDTIINKLLACGDDDCETCALRRRINEFGCR